MALPRPEILVGHLCLPFSARASHFYMVLWSVEQ
jgi:hypothetical protein